jgi:hypothetical protein
LVLPLVLVLPLQLALLVFVAVSWREPMDKTVSWNLAMDPEMTKQCAGVQDAWPRALLALANVGALCALALYTHAEVQDAVDLFQGLKAQQPDGQGVQNHRPQGAVWTLLVPVLQLVVAIATLFVQGIVFLSYRVPIAKGEAKYTNVMEAVYACVALAFICDLDNRAWVFVKPLLQAAAPPGNASQSACCSDGDSSLLLLLAQVWSSCCSRAPRVHFTRLQCCSHVVCAWSWFKWLLACLLAGPKGLCL